MQTKAQFSVGQVVQHRLFEYRGVIIDVDPTFNGSDDWYEQVARSRPPKEAPWYHVLVHGGEHQTYVAERNLELDEAGEPVVHPEIDRYFQGISDGVYVPRHALN
ncbi:MAG: heat shock protein HspQ [Gammaproteobacteria bacterium]|nr:heat shock protein HspQ [Gammaproteobacteria bacterium]